jgi:hypothetical protein
MRALIPIAGALILMAPAFAQTPPQDGWVWSEFGFGLIAADRNFAPIGSPGHAAGGGPGTEYSVDSGWQIWEFGPPLMLRHFTPTNAPVLFSLQTQGAYPCHDRRRVWLIDGNGLLSWVDKNNPTAEYPAGNLHSAWASNEYVGSMCTNGRDLFFSIKVTAADPYHVFAVDTQASPLTARPLASMPVGSTEVYGPTLAIGQGGVLLASYNHAMWSIDPGTGTVQQLFSEPPDPFFGGPQKKLMGYNPWTDELATTVRDVYFGSIYGRNVMQPGTWQLRWPSNGFLGTFALACAAERPFELYGRGCNNSLSRDPRLGWTGMPQPGSTFTIQLRDAEPSGVALAWLGLSDSAWAPVGALPFDLATYGAPGCRLLASVDSVVLVPIDALGHAAVTHPVPTVAGLVGLDLFAQTMSSSTANSLGLVTSDALMVRIR